MACLMFEHGVLLACRYPTEGHANVHQLRTVMISRSSGALRCGFTRVCWQYQLCSATHNRPSRPSSNPLARSNGNWWGNTVAFWGLLRPRHYCSSRFSSVEFEDPSFGIGDLLPWRHRYLGCRYPYCNQLEILARKQSVANL